MMNRQPATFRVVIDLGNGWRAKIGPLVNADRACGLHINIARKLVSQGIAVDRHGINLMIVAEPPQDALRLAA